MSTRSKRTLAGVGGIAFVLMAVLMVARIAWGQESRGQAAVRPPTNADGRFQIVMRDGVRADTFLLDTHEGRLWQLTQYPDVEGTPTDWKYMERIDSREDLLMWGAKKKWVAEKKK